MGVQVDVLTLAITTLVTGAVGWLVKAVLDALRGYIAQSAEWRSKMDERMDEQDATIRAVLEAQCTQMRSDITHKVHRYMDDLRAASTEEKQSLWAEYEVYCVICAKYGIENHFVEQLVRQVMELPDRTASE